MWIGVLEHGLQWYDRLQAFSQGDPFERLIPQAAKTSGVESILAVIMVLSVAGSAAESLQKFCSDLCRPGPRHVLNRSAEIDGP